MSAWDKLLAASRLDDGTAWQLISSPKTVGVGGSVFCQGANVWFQSDPYAVAVDTPDYVIAVDVKTLGIAVEGDSASSTFVDGAEVSVSVSSSQFSTEITP